MLSNYFTILNQAVTDVPDGRPKPENDLEK